MSKQLRGTYFITDLRRTERVVLVGCTVELRKVRLRGKGMPIYRREGSHGDLIVTYSVTIPTTLTARQRELYEELQKESLA